MQRSHATRALIISAILAIILALVYTGWWVSFAFGARDGVERWAKERRMEGWQVSYDDIALRGYPFTVNMRLRQPRISQPGRFDWQGADVIAAISPLNPSSVTVRAPGKHQIRIPDVDTVQLEAATAEGVVNVSARGRPTGGSMRLQGVSATSSAGTTNMDSFQIQIEEMLPPNNRSHEAIPGTIGFGVALGNLELPPQVKLPFGKRVAVATLRGRLRGQWEPIEFTQALANWRDGGGVIELDELMLRWDPVSLAANGTLALDQRLQPLVAVSARVTGFFEVIDSLTAARVIRTRDANVAKMVLGALSRPPADGGPAVLELPLTVQDGVFHAGPAVLGKIPELPWQAPPPMPIPGLPSPVKR